MGHAAAGAEMTAPEKEPAPLVPTHAYGPLKPDRPLTARRAIGAWVFWFWHYVLGAPLPCSRCKYCLDTTRFRQVDQPENFEVILCVEANVREHYNSGENERPDRYNANTPTCEEARSAAGPCGPKPKFFKRK
jgi:hypothetical protein